MMMGSSHIPMLVTKMKQRLIETNAWHGASKKRNLILRLTYVNGLAHTGVESMSMLTLLEAEETGGKDTSVLYLQVLKDINT